MKTRRPISPPGYARFDLLEFPPSGRLQKYIECYWSLQGATADAAPVTEQLIPGGRVEIIFPQSPFLWLNDPSDKAPQSMDIPFVLGQRSRISYTRLGSRFRFLGIRFKPGCFSLFTQVPAARFKNSISPLPALYPSLPSTESEDRALRIAHIENWLLDNFQGETADWTITQSILQELAGSSQESLSIKELSEKQHWGYKKLERAFHKWVGYTPREFARIMRFKSAMENSSPRNSLTRSGYEGGFYDQSHFIREFQHYTGQPPSHFFKKPSRIASMLYKLKE